MKKIFSLNHLQFEQYISNFNFEQLTSLLRDIKEFKTGRLWGKVFTEEQVMHMERCETKIVKALQARGYLSQSDLTKYLSHMSEIRTKRIF